MSQGRTKQGNWFIEEWTATFAGVLESLCHERPMIACKSPADNATIDSATSEIARQHGAILWWKQAFPLAGQPVLWVGAPESGWSQLGIKVLRAADNDSSSEARGTYFEVVQRSFDNFSRAVGRRLNEDIAGSGGVTESGATGRG